MSAHMNANLSASFCVALLLLGGCTLTPSTTCERGGAQDGSCCPPWSFVEQGRCAPRRWTSQLQDDGLGEDASHPSIDIDRTNRVWLAYEDAYASGSDIYLAKEDGAGWSLSVPSAGLGEFNSEPRVSAVDDATSVLVWNRSGAATELQNHVRVGVSGGAMIEPPGGGRFSFSPYAYQNEAYANSDGELFLTWNQGLDFGMRRGICVATRHEGKPAFERPKNQLDVLSRSFIFSNNPEVARNTRGDAVVTWYESIGEKLRVLPSERYGLGGPFTIAHDEDALSPPDGDVENPEPAVAEDGSAAIVWRQVLPTGKMAVFLAERPYRGVWSRPTIDAPFSGVSDNAWNTRVAFAPTGDLYVAWEEKNGDDWAVMLAHREPSGRWLASGTAALRLSSHPAIEPVLRVAADGTVVVVWRARFGTRWRVMARRSAVDAEGLREVDRWLPAEALSDEDADAGAPTLAVSRDATARGHRFAAAWSQDGHIHVATLD